MSAPPTSKTQWELPVLSLLTAERNAFGLRTRDYKRYRTHCANKVHRLRQVLKLTHGKVKGYKPAPPITPETLTDVRALHLLLFQSDRLYAHSRELQPTLPRVAHTRLRRALQSSSLLLSLALSLPPAHALPASHLAQIAVQHLVLLGTIHLDASSYTPALHAFSLAHALLARIARLEASDDRARALAQAAADEVAPQVRYCAYQLGERGTAHEVERVVEEHLPAARESGALKEFDVLVERLEEATAAREAQGGKAQLEPLTWRGEVVDVRNAELVDVLLRVQRTRGALANSKKPPRSKYDGVLLAYTDAVGVAAGLLSSAGGASSSSLQTLHDTLAFRLLDTRLERDLALAGGLGDSPADERARVKLLDGVLQTLGQMKELGVVEEDDELSGSLEAKVEYYKALRNHHLARSHHFASQPAEALTLLSAAHLYLRSARTLLPPSPSAEDRTPLSPERDLDAHDARVSKAEEEAKRAWFAARTARRPLFFDLAGAGVGVPMQALLERAGRETGEVQEEVREVQEKVKEVRLEEKPVVEDVGMREQERGQEQEQEQKGRGSWLGSLWGRK